MTTAWIELLQVVVQLSKKTGMKSQILYLVDQLGNQTGFHPPTFEEVLKWSKGKTFLSVDIKRGVPFEKVVEIVHKYEAKNRVFIITYSAEMARALYKIDASLMQSVSMRNDEEFDAMMRTGIPTELMVAFTGTRLSDKSLFQRIHREHILCILGTLGNLDKRAESRGDRDYDEYIKMGIDILATDRPFAAWQMIKDDNEVDMEKFLMSHE